jgi:hypothetical protein
MRSATLRPAGAIETGTRLSRLREPGLWQQKYVDRVAVLEDALDKAALEHFSLANDGIQRVTDVAGEMLQRAGWGGP